MDTLALLGGLVLPLTLATAADAQLLPWASKAQPGDLAKSHVEQVRDARHQYSITQGGTMDGENCRSPMGCGMAREGAIEQTWQSNRLVRLENVGQTNIVNPWLSNGRNNFRNIDEIVAVAADPKLSDRQKAMLLWFQQIRYRYHRSGAGEEQGDPVKVYNCYGFNPCGSDAIMMGGLWRRVGGKGAPARLVGHSISQAWFDGRWNLLDGDLDQFFLLRDNQTIANDRDLARDHDLVKRAHTLGILWPDSRGTDENEAAMFVCEDEIKGDRRCREDTTMNMTLRPGEAITWRWGHLDPPKYMWKGTGPEYPDTACNGLWEYRPDLAGELWKQGALAVENIISTPAGLSAQPGTTGTITWVVRSPYVFVGGRLDAEASRAVQFAVSADGKQWADIQKNSAFDDLFPTNGAARYEYRLRCTLRGDSRLSALKLTNDLQMALLTLPEMRVGENLFTYNDSSPGPRNVRITHEWVERSTSRPPSAPPAPVSPADGALAEGSKVVFRWQAPAQTGGGPIADYHFELSDQSDLKYPLSTNFYKLISRTADKGKAQYSLPQEGLLSPGQTYYWRVRARNTEGVWGAWSSTWSFGVRAPTEPVDVALTFDASSGTGTLRWKPNPSGNRPVIYRVYASDEKGFSISDVPYAVNVGTSKELPAKWPANFVTETSAPELAVIGPSVELPNANKTYYRVVAVDQQANRSGPSDYASAPRPVIFSKPLTQAKVGQPYSYRAVANRSLGDLRFRQIAGREVANFWDVEKPVFAIEQGPAWLKVDPATGVLSGTPDAPQQAAVVISVTIDREVRKLSEQDLGWGRENVTSTVREQVGKTSQRFTIDVAAEAPTTAPSDPARSR